MKVILSGGGTGGHIYPALTIASQIEKIEPKAEIVFVGTKNGLESNIVPRYNYKMRYMEVAGFRRRISYDTIVSLKKLIVSIFEAKNILSIEKPDLVIGTGGYVCGPILFLAALRGIPTCIQEQNAMPGVTNKILARVVKKVCLGYEDARKYFGGSSEKILTGNPIREEIMQISKEKAQEELKLTKNATTILVSGGSRGARSINNAMKAVVEKFAGRDDVQIMMVTGDVGYQDFIKDLSFDVLNAKNIKIYSYLHDMPQALAAANLAIFRAGAIGLAELTGRGLPSILIPYPYATANHQEYNARAIEKNGGAEVILDKELNGERLISTIENLIVNPSRLEKMAQASKKIGKPEAANKIAKEALELIKTRSN